MKIKEQKNWSKIRCNKQDKVKNVWIFKFKQTTQ